MKHKIKPIAIAAALLAFGLFIGAGGAAAATTDILPGPETPLVEGGGIGILDQLYGLGNLVRVDDDFDQIWNPANGDTMAQAKFADFSQEFGYIPQGRDGSYNAADFVHLFDVAGGTNGIGFGGPSAALSSGDVNFIWALNPSGSPLWTSWLGLNSDSVDHMVTWRISGNEGSPNNPIGGYVIAWEDLQFGDPESDHDFNDLVVEVNIAPVPIPPAFLLLGSGLIGLVGLRKKLS